MPMCIDWRRASQVYSPCSLAEVPTHVYHGRSWGLQVVAQGGNTRFRRIFPISITPHLLRTNHLCQ